LKVRHPLTGGGMTVAFNDVWLITEALGHLPSLRDERAVLRAQEQFFEDRKSLAAQINILAQALLRVFLLCLIRVF
jgi:squalene monooxygenase